MAAITSIWTEKKIAQRVKDGFGQGELADYKSWLSLGDLSSYGTSTRLYSPKLKRTMVFFSNIERNAYLYAEWQPHFVDYWENRPLDVDHTGRAASALGIRHPTYPFTRLRCVMTVDAVATFRTSTGLRRDAWDCKTSKSLSKNRTMNKLLIHGDASAAMGYSHRVITEKTIPDGVIDNILWIRRSRSKAYERTDAAELARQKLRLYESLQHDLPRAKSHARLWEYCDKRDRNEQMELGQSMRYAKMLMSSHIVKFDLASSDRWTLSCQQLSLDTRRADSEFALLAA